jgi:hypothetical protein
MCESRLIDRTNSYMGESDSGCADVQHRKSFADRGMDSVVTGGVSA